MCSFSRFITPVKVRSTGVAGSSAARASAGATAQAMARHGERIVQRATPSRSFVTGWYSPPVPQGPRHKEKR